MLDVYQDIIRPTEQVLWEREGCSEGEIAYRLAVLDAEYNMQHRLEVTQSILWLFSFIPYVRQLLRYWEVYEECCVASVAHEARALYLEALEPDLPSNVIPFPKRYE